MTKTIEQEQQEELARRYRLRAGPIAYLEAIRDLLEEADALPAEQVELLHSEVADLVEE